MKNQDLPLPIELELQVFTLVGTFSQLALSVTILQLLSRCVFTLFGLAVTSITPLKVFKFWGSEHVHRIANITSAAHPPTLSSTHVSPRVLYLASAEPLCKLPTLIILLQSLRHIHVVPPCQVLRENKMNFGSSINLGTTEDVTSEFLLEKGLRNFDRVVWQLPHSPRNAPMLRTLSSRSRNIPK